MNIASRRFVQTKFARHSQSRLSHHNTGPQLKHAPLERHTNPLSKSRHEYQGRDLNFTSYIVETDFGERNPDSSSSPQHRFERRDAEFLANSGEDSIDPGQNVGNPADWETIVRRYGSDSLHRSQYSRESDTGPKQHHRGQAESTHSIRERNTASQRGLIFGAQDDINSTNNSQSFRKRIIVAGFKTQAKERDSKMTSTTKLPQDQSPGSIDIFKRHEIVSSFLLAPSSEGHKLVIFKRSPAKKIYPNKWAVCSGSIEPTDASPEEAAKREIHEETSLSSRDVTLFTKGKPYMLVDADIETVWIIYPFAWELKGDSKAIRLNEEHTEFKLIDPGELGTYDHVVNLELALPRVLMSDHLVEDLATLRAEPSTPLELVQNVLKRFQLAINAGDLGRIETTPDFWAEVLMRAWHYVESSGQNEESKKALKDALGTVLRMAMSMLECETREQVKGKELRSVKNAVSQFVSADELEQSVAYFKMTGSDQWESIMAEL